MTNDTSRVVEAFRDIFTALVGDGEQPSDAYQEISGMLFTGVVDDTSVVDADGYTVGDLTADILAILAFADARQDGPPPTNMLAATILACMLLLTPRQTDLFTGEELNQLLRLARQGKITGVTFE